MSATLCTFGLQPDLTPIHYSFLKLPLSMHCDFNLCLYEEDMFMYCLKFC